MSRDLKNGENSAGRDRIPVDLYQASVAGLDGAELGVTADVGSSTPAQTITSMRIVI